MLVLMVNFPMVVALGNLYLELELGADNNLASLNFELFTCAVCLHIQCTCEWNIAHDFAFLMELCIFIK